MLGFTLNGSSKFIRIILILLVIILSYSNIRQNESINALKSKNDNLVKTNKTLESNLMPECNFGHCPEYDSFNTDDDSDWESVVEIPTTMNRGAGEIWIIDKGKVVFKHEGGAGVSYRVPCYGKDQEVDKECGGIFISYISSFDSTALNPDVWTTEEWRYREGKYVLINTVFEKDSIDN